MALRDALPTENHDAMIRLFFIAATVTAAAVSPRMDAGGLSRRVSASPVPLVGADGTTSGSAVCLRAAPGFYTSEKDGAVAWTRNADRFVGLAYVGYRGQGYPVSLFDWATN